MLRYERGIVDGVDAHVWRGSSHGVQDALVVVDHDGQHWCAQTTLDGRYSATWHTEEEAAIERAMDRIRDSVPCMWSDVVTDAQR